MRKVGIARSFNRATRDRCLVPRLSSVVFWELDHYNAQRGWALSGQCVWKAGATGWGEGGGGGGGGGIRHKL